MSEFRNTYPKKGRIWFQLGALVGLCISVSLLVLLVFVVSAECERWTEFLFCVVLTSPWIICGFLFFASYLFFTNERIRIDADALYVKYSILPWKRIPWDSLKGIYLCNYIVNSRTVAFGWPVICCVRHHEKEGLLNCRWKMYSMLHLFGVVTMNDSNEVRAAFEACCPLPIQDYRMKLNYRLPENEIIR